MAFFCSWNFFTLCPCFCPTNPGYACFSFMSQFLAKLYRSSAPIYRHTWISDGDIALWIQLYRDSIVFEDVNNIERLSQAVLLHEKLCLEVRFLPADFRCKCVYSKFPPKSLCWVKMVPCLCDREKKSKKTAQEKDIVCLRATKK